MLDALSFALGPGEMVRVGGRNGAGKSTLLRTVAGLIKPVGGAVTFGAASAEVRGVETAHYLGYEDALKPALSVGENLAFWAAMLAGDTRAGGMAVADALAAFGVRALIDLRAGVLSAGQKRRVALARMLLARRPLWLLDEPLIALDDEAQATLGAVMAAHLAGAGAILVASHQPLALAHRLIDLGRRGAAAAGTPTASRPA